MFSFLQLTLRAKVTTLILILITIVLVSAGVYVSKTQSSQMTRALNQSGKQETRTLRFLSARAILTADDLGIIDNLQNISRIDGFVYGRVENSAESVIAQTGSIPKTLQKEILKGRFAALSKDNDAAKMENKSIQIQTKIFDDNGLHYYRFYSKIVHPFVKNAPPEIGHVTLIFSDEAANKVLKKNLLNLAIAGFLFWIVGILGSWALSVLIVKPINTLSEGASILGEGKLTHRLPDLGTDEIGALARQFNSMAAGLQDAQAQREAKLIIDEQIKQATEIQEGMNPARFINRPNLQIKGFTRAAKGVGGDYFDYHFLPDGRVAISITDVSGKSISASLVMVLIKTVISTYTKLFKKIRGDKILTIINRVMCDETHIDKFATTMFCVYDPNSRDLEFTNAGHGPLLLYRANTNEITVSKIEGLPLGIDEDNDYGVGKTKLFPQDMVVLVTDGITESWDKNNNNFGLTRLREKIFQYKSLNAKEIVENIVKDIDSFTQGGEQHDDMTILILKIPPA